MTRLQWLRSRLSGKLWFRASLFSFGAVLTALIAVLAQRYIPEDWSRKIGAEAVDDILTIIASSMLTITTFSLGVMVTAYAAASSNATPRSTKLLIEDDATQNVLSTFMGAFIFSLVSIIVLHMGLYTQSGRLVLFGVTLLVVALIIVTILRWIDHISRIGRMEHAINCVEAAVTKAVTYRTDNPYLGAQQYAGQDIKGKEVCCDRIGYVQYINLAGLQRLCEENNCRMYIRAVPGHFNDGHSPLLLLTGEGGSITAKQVIDAFVIEHARTFEQDPRFGLSVLTEIAARALSPGINDSGTAISVIASGYRVLDLWGRNQQNSRSYEVLYSRLYIPALENDDMFDDFFMAIMRDGAGRLEVMLRLQKALYGLGQYAPFRAIARQHQQRVLALARNALPLEEDWQTLDRKEFIL